MMPVDILKYIQEGERLYVLLDPKKLGSSENVQCYTVTGDFIWQIEDIFKMEGDNYFTVLGLEDNSLYAYNVNGIKVTIDKETGKFLTKVLAK